ncbi:MAG: fumarylacetoacetate hydrolase family protein [bacterium]|nr:fumarylacetoacetate hydrolase family protein [bacterium]MDE0374785.1 fumarylacetoacetate hydrolase family protein [bacterium]
MRIARFNVGGSEGWGLVCGEQVCPVKDGTQLMDVLGDREALAALFDAAGPEHSLSDVQLLAPVADPPQFLGIGLNYRLHAAETGAAIPESPICFPFFNSSIINPGDAICLPPFTDKVDWEVELAVVIGKEACCVSEEDAVDYIAGYTIVNDVSARDIQLSEGQWSRAKSFDTFKPMGPWIVTADELGAAGDLDVKLWVNGEIKQDGETSDLIFNVPQLVSHMSQHLTLGVGAVISTGTPSGVGMARKPPEYLRAGDEVTLEVEGIGRLTNPVEAAGC